MFRACAGILVTEYGLASVHRASPSASQASTAWRIADWALWAISARVAVLRIQRVCAARDSFSSVLESANHLSILSRAMARSASPSYRCTGDKPDLLKNRSST